MDRISRNQAIQGNYGINTPKDAYLQKIKSDFAKDFDKTPNFESETSIDGNRQKLVVCNTKEFYSKKIIAYVDETFSKGQVVDCYNKKWIIDEVDPNNQIYTVGTMKYCPFVFKFQDLNGKIVSYPYFLETFTDASGENKYISFSESMIKIRISFDSNTINFYMGLRLMGEIINGKPQCWKIVELINNDGVLLVYLEKDEFDEEKDNKTLGICDYKYQSNISSGIIISGLNKISKSETLKYISTEDVFWSISNIDESTESYVSTSDITDTEIKITSLNIIGKYIKLKATSQSDSEIYSELIIQITNTF